MFGEDRTRFNSIQQHQRCIKYPLVSRLWCTHHSMACVFHLWTLCASFLPVLNKLFIPACILKFVQAQVVESGETSKHICPTPCVAEFISMHEGRTLQSNSPRHPRKMKSSQGQLKRPNPSCAWKLWVLRASPLECNSIVDGLGLFGVRFAPGLLAGCRSNPKTLLLYLLFTTKST